METNIALNQKTRFLDDNVKFIDEVKPRENDLNIGNFQYVDEIDDEIWLMQVPKGMDTSMLISQQIKLPGRSNFNTLETIAVEDLKDAQDALAVGYSNRKGKYSIRYLPIKGNIVLRQRLAASDPERFFEKHNETDSTLKNSDKIPKTIKVRHPLFGANFEKQLITKRKRSSIPSMQQDKMEHVCETTAQKKSKKKRNK